MDKQPEETNRSPTLFPTSQNSPHQEIQSEEIFDCSCPDCYYERIWKENVRRHEKDDNPTVNWDLSCQICSQKYRCLVGFFHHMSSQHPNKLFCSSCLFLAQNLTEFNAHMLAHSSTQSVPTVPFNCNPENVADFNAPNPESICQMSPETAENSDSTLRIVAIGEQILKRASDRNKFRCGNCSTTFRRRKSLLRHENKKCTARTIEDLGETVNLQGEPQYSCHICSFRTKWKPSLRSHLKCHSDLKPFHCPIAGCKYRAKWTQSVRNHTRNVHHIALPPGTPLENKENLRPIMDHETETEVDVNHSSSSMAYACMLCDFIGDSELSALEHARQHTAVEISLNQIY